MLELIQVQGYAGTGLNTVTEHARAPKGSLYFHFPDGKEALGEQAVDLAARQFRLLVDDTIHQATSPRAMINGIAEVLTSLLTDSDYQLGCPVSVVTLEMGAASERLRSACATAFGSWIASLTDYLTATGYGPTSARTLATAIVSSFEGAVILSRAQRSPDPVHAAARVLATVLDGRPLDTDLETT
ncbi:TetR family transcriptional regulator [Micromonospora echinofusca]|uniref:TetR family transcriptional regulator n=2 Tax=Micromonospora echinofusca TaxID=47858 RepID=A0ABS3VSA4_MICEH|nr:TetR family transcriptional regulator [Micromonospora echinofusca]